MSDKPRIAVVIPCFRVARQIPAVIAAIPSYVDDIVIVDDCCPEKSGQVALQATDDPRVTAIRLTENHGVGGAVLTGMQYAVSNGADILVKIDGDGQHDPQYIPYMTAPIINGAADYTKGNRFFQLEFLKDMPRARIIGNAGLSFLTKISSGYWTLMDPTNGFVAIHARIFNQLPLEKLNQRYFFESDMLFRLGTLRANVMQIPMASIYREERSGIRPMRMLGPMLKWHTKCLIKRFAYCYFLRGFSLASVYLILGLVLSVLGVGSGISYWMHYANLGTNAPTGTIMLVALLVIFGANFLFSFFSHDMSSEPREAVHPHLPRAAADSERSRLAEYQILRTADERQQANS